MAPELRCHSVKVFKIQKRIIRIITNSNRYDTCCPLFKQLGILPLPSQYIVLCMHYSQYCILVGVFHWDLCWLVCWYIVFVARKAMFKFVCLNGW